MDVQEAVDAPRFHPQWLSDVTNVESFELSPDTRKIFEGWDQKFGDPRRNSGLALGY